MTNQTNDENQTEPEDFPYCLIGGENGKNLLSKEENCSDGRRRLQALLAQWMRMENMVVLMGAGCSYAHGGLVMTALEKKVLGFLQDIYQSEQGKNSNLLRVVRSRFSKESGPGFELWLSYLSNIYHLLTTQNQTIGKFSLQLDNDEDSKTDESSQSNGHQNGQEGSSSQQNSDQHQDTSPVFLTKKDVETLLADLKRAIYTYCALQLPKVAGNSDDKASGHHAFFAKLVARDATLGRSHVFTLNYDTLIEQALDHLGIHYWDGFTGRTEALFDPATYGLDLYFPGEIAEGRVRRFDKFLHLYKLHGSIHWREREDHPITASHSDLAPFVKWCKEKAGEPPESYISSFNRLWENREHPIAILPTSNKFVQTLDMPYAHLFRLFHQRLHVPQTFLLVLGYGFGDEHVNRMIDQAMTNPSLVLLVVTPNEPSGAIKKHIERYQSVGERAFLLYSTKNDPTKEPTRATFDDFAHKLLPHVQWIEDFKKLRKFENEIQSSFKKSDGAAQ